jgi:Secretion system C-terminal sorting domain
MKWIIVLFSILGTVMHAYCQQYASALTSPEYLTTEPALYKVRYFDIDNDGNKYVLSTFKDSVTIKGNAKLYTQLHNNFDWSKAIYLTKVNATDSVLWVIKIAECDTNYSMAVLHNQKGGAYVAFSFNGNMYLAADTIKSRGNTDIILCEFDSNGVETRFVQIGSYRGEEFSGKALTRDQNGAIYFTGVFNFGTVNANPTYQIFLDSTYSITANDAQSFIVKFDRNLKVIKAATFGGQAVDAPMQIVHGAGNIYGYGVVLNSIQNLYGGIDLDFTTLPNLNQFIFLICLDSNLNTKWYRRLGTEVTLQSLSIFGLGASAKGVAIAGHGWNGSSATQFYCDGGGSFNGTASFDYFLVFYGSSGTFQNAYVSKSIGDEDILDIICDSSGNFYCTGSFNYDLKFPSDTLKSYGSNDAFVSSYDPQGNFRWAASGGGYGSDIAYDIAINDKQQIAIVGATNSIGGCLFGNDTLFVPGPGAHVFYASIDSIVLNTTPNFISAQSQPALKIFPNPATTLVQIETNKINGELYVYDVSGRVMHHTTMPLNSYKLDTSTWPKGVYYISYQINQTQSHNKIIIR